MKRSVFRCLTVWFVILLIIGLISVPAQSYDVLEDLGNYLLLISAAKDNIYLWPAATTLPYDLARTANGLYFRPNPFILPSFDPFRVGLQSNLFPAYYGYYWPIIGMNSLVPNFGIYNLFGF